MENNGNACAVTNNCPMMQWCPIFMGDSTADDINLLDTKQNGGRVKNVYDVQDKDEQRRLAIQLGLTRESDVRNLKMLTEGKDKIAVMDIGCNNGKWLRDRLSRIGKVCNAVVGVELNAEMKDSAAEVFPEMVFVNADAEKDTFSEILYKTIPAEQKFDVIVLSMVLLHTQEMKKVLRNVYKFLKDDGYLYIRDMDDGLALSYPDSEGIVKRMLSISHNVRYTGNRHSGREIYTALKQTGYSYIRQLGDVVDVTTKPEGLDDYEYREYLYTTNFQYIKGDLELAYRDDSTKYANDLKWFNKAYEDLHEKFHNTDYYYKMGTIVYCARKK